MRITALTGAGISAESGIATFRDSNGLWENHRVEDVASPEGFARDPELVLNFYNLRRAQLHTVKPNRGHEILAEMEAEHDVTIVTQNIDDLHERAGSTNVIHLHGELLKARPAGRMEPVVDWPGDIKLGDEIAGRQARPHIVWFGESVPKLEDGAMAVVRAEVIIIVGTSLQVYPAAGLVSYAAPGVPVIYIDPNPAENFELNQRRDVHLIRKGGSEGMVEALALIETFSA